MKTTGVTLSQSERKDQVGRYGDDRARPLPRPAGGDV